MAVKNHSFNFRKLRKIDFTSSVGTYFFHHSIKICGWILFLGNDEAKNSKKCIRFLYKDNILDLEPCEIKRGFLLNDYEKNSVSGFEFNKVYVFFKDRKTPYDLDDLNFLENRNMSW